MSYFLKRLLLVPVTAAGISIACFLLFHFSPGGPLEEYLNRFERNGVHFQSLSDVQKQYLRSSFEYDKPMTQRYLRWLHRWIEGDWGTSSRYGTPIRELITSRVVPTLYFWLVSSFFVLNFSLFLALLSAGNFNSKIDTGVSFFASFLMSIPGFSVALFCLYYLADWTRLPTTGWDEKTLLASTLLPTVTYSLHGIGFYIFLNRNMLIQEMKKPYILGARVTGMSEWTTLTRYAIPASISQLLQSLPQWTLLFIGASCVIEPVFRIPGIGALYLESIRFQDYTMTQSILLLFVVCVLCCNLVRDILASRLDPRISFRVTP